MKTKLGILILAILVFATTFSRAQTNDLTSLLQQGLLEEQANRNLDAAIADYQTLAAQFDKNRQIAATAVFRLGECYRMLGKTNEAAAQYQRVLKDFSDQPTLATLSRQNLTGMGMSSDSTPNSDVLQRLFSQRQKEMTIGNSDEESQEIQRIQTMIQNSPDLINAPSLGANGNSTPLENAAAHGWLKVTTYLLEHGADVHARGDEALFSATRVGNRAMVEFLLSRGANVNANNSGDERNTPLHIAVTKGFQSIVEVLLSNKADVNAQTRSGYTPLILASQLDNSKIVSLLLEHKADVGAQSHYGLTPLINAAYVGQFENMKLLLAAGANPNLVGAGDKEPMRGGLPEFRGRTALSFAAGNNLPEMVKLLLGAKADPNVGTLDAPLLVAIHAKDTNSTELLLQAGANPNVKEAVDFLIPNNSSGVTPLYVAISTKQLPMVQLLLKFKADPNDSQTDERPVLFSALGDTNILEALLGAGAKVDAGDTSSFAKNNGRLNWTPLLYAAQNKSEADSVGILLKHGANPNVRDSGGNTPLHRAAYNVPGKNVFQWLLDAKADPNVRNDQGETPLDILKRVSVAVGNYGNISPEQRTLAGQLADLLRQHGALDKLPDWNSITVSRPSANFSEVVFQKGTNDWNQFTLLEAILNFYGSSRTHSISQGNGMQMMNSGDDALPFPDLNRVIIVRPSHGSTNQTKIVVNLLNGTNGIDASKDVPLEFGDVVEISELDHALGARPVGLTDGQRETLFSLLKGNVRLTVHGQTVEIPIYHCFDSSVHLVLGQSEARNLLLSSSDLSRVKVIRRDVKTGKAREWILDCRQPESPTSGVVLTAPISYQWFGANNSLPSTDLWLCDGDVIEVPEK